MRAFAAPSAETDLGLIPTASADSVSPDDVQENARNRVLLGSAILVPAAAFVLVRRYADPALKRGLDVAVSAFLLLVLAPLVLALAIAIKLDSPGEVFYRCRRVGKDGREFGMLKFRKMRNDAAGVKLTSAHDARFTRIGRFLASSKLDEIPQLWNVLGGTMSLVGPRPEDPGFIAEQRVAYRRILTVRPGITGLTQLAFARESEILDPEDRVGHYIARLLPQKARLDCLYVARRTIWMDIRILVWTAVAVLVRRDVAVHRETGRMNLRAPRQGVFVPSAAPSEVAAS
ncbi:MAG TPA: sugar transferase [Gaiellaceae bacterium]|jgi:lipopolysaccharide/colanic/teichoic acid biosynthesis glycosyltransferase|nr:sugar transferase [Gaiellaceae bacterium]